MSDASKQSLKISREGIVLIKSFEGFRPRAIRREEGGWVIGYGHTLSAREGATVSEADAELLLRYDLLPVEKAVNAAAPASLNQHQFDALVSFAFSVGIEPFGTSDVRQRLVAGAPGEAADAMLGWPEPAVPEAALRRRAAERALFSADPSAPVALSELLAAPLPPPPAASESPPPAASEPETTADTPAVDPRGAAVAALLGEASQPETAEALPQGPEPSDESASDPILTPDFSSHQAPLVQPEAAEPPFQPSPPDDAAQSPAQAEPEIPAAISEPDETEAEAGPAEPTFDPSAMMARRFSPYGIGVIGPIPHLPVVRPTPSTLTAATPSEVEAAPVAPASAPADDPAEAPDHAVAEPVRIDGPALETPVADAPLVLTPPDEAPATVHDRPLWSPEQRAAAEPPAEAGLFGEDLALTPGGGPILRHEIEPEAPTRFDWSETGAFIIMGAVGLTAFGASMAAFRLASEQSGAGNETTLIAWVLAIIGATCVGVSSFNLYRRWGLPGGD